MSGSFVLLPGSAGVFLVGQTGRMGEQAARDPAAAISPTQQMLASSTGALLTAIFGEPKHTHRHEEVRPDGSVPPSSSFVLA